MVAAVDVAAIGIIPTPPTVAVTRKYPSCHLPPAIPTTRNMPTALRLPTNPIITTTTTTTTILKLAMQAAVEVEVGFPVWVAWQWVLPWDPESNGNGTAPRHQEAGMMM